VCRMFRRIRDRIALYKLNRQERKLNAEGERIHKEAREKKDQSIVDEWYGTTAYWQYEEIQWSRKKIPSDALLQEADELHLPRPQYGDKDKWEEDRPQMVTDYVLTPEAMAELRTTIRKEKRERRETVEWWVKIIGGLITIGTGLVGALIGLVSVWKHR
jgi:hypothetical protein